MAGSYRHATAGGDGKLLCNEDFVRMVENLGDAYETVEEMYGMIWWLAADLSEHGGISPSTLVEFAREEYRDGLRLSPGTDGVLPEEDES